MYAFGGRGALATEHTEGTEVASVFGDNYAVTSQAPRAPAQPPEAYTPSTQSVILRTPQRTKNLGHCMSLLPNRDPSLHSG